MAKGYWMARLDIRDEAAYAEYRKLNGIAFAKFGGKFLVRGGPAETVKGPVRQHNVVIEFDSHEKALACYRSPEYQAAKKFLDQVGEVELVVVPGYEGPQPS
jgi:uncharacterized protein (DUF1330 family)